MHSDRYDKGLYNDLLKEYSTSLSKQPSHYTSDQRTAIDTYSGNGYKQLNEALRTGDRGALDEPAFRGSTGDVTYQGVADHLLVAMSQTRTTRDVVVFRGVKEGGLPPLRVGDELVDRGFISTSMDPGEAEGFSYNKLGTVLQVVVPKGTPALRGNPDEHELILRPGTRMKVVGKDSNGHIKVVLL